MKKYVVTLHVRAKTISEAEKLKGEIEVLEVSKVKEEEEEVEPQMVVSGFTYDRKRKLPH